MTILIKKTEVVTGAKARRKIYRGVNLLANVVTITLGAKGRNVAIAMQDYKGDIFKRDIIHDGVRVAEQVNPVDEFENMGASVLREAAQKTVMAVGDGTTVTILLAQAIFNSAHSMVENGADPVEIREGLEEVVKDLVKALDKYAHPIKTRKQAQDIAVISCQDVKLGKLIADTLYELGVDGVVTVEESKSAETRVEHQVGMQLDKGFWNNYFVTNPDTMTATLENPYILITDKNINSLEPLVTILNEMHQRQAPLVIIAPSITGEAMPLLIQNKLTGKLNILAIQAPSFGENQKEVLRDIAALTGGRFIPEDANFKFEDLTLKDLGKCERITSDKNSTVIVGGKGTKADTEARVKGIKKALEEEEGDFEREKLRERFGRLTKGVAVIYVGGFTEIEMKDRKERVIDAVAATKAAMKKGIVPGGEVVFLHLIDELTVDTPAARVLRLALTRPFMKLMGNAGLDSGQMMERLINSSVHNAGVDVRDGEIKDMIEAGIVDPLLVLENALQNSVSVASQLILTDGIIVPVDTKEGD